MPLYEYQCEHCDNYGDIFRTVDGRDEPYECPLCGHNMKRVISCPNSGNKEYGKTKWSDSLAISPTQVAEHRRLFPDIKVDDKSGRIGFDNYKQHDAYLEKTGFEKAPQKIRKKGKRIA